MKAYVILADGFEELEAVTVIDILRRGGVDVLLIGLTQLQVVGTHQLQLKADCLLNDADPNQSDAIILPGGLPGADYLAKSTELKVLLQTFNKQNKLIAAICAAPWALATAGVLKDQYCCYPGFEQTIAQAGYQQDQNVVVCDNIITSKGPATAMEFGLAILTHLMGKTVATQIEKQLLFSASQ